MLVQEQKQNRTSRCKKCNQDVPNSQLYAHYENCQKQCLNDQPNSKEIPEQVKPTVIDDKQQLHQHLSNIVPQEDELQANQQQVAIGFRMLKLCETCQEYFQVEIYYNHLNECQTQKQAQILNQNSINTNTLIFQCSEEIGGNFKAFEQVKEEHTSEIIHSNYIVYKKTKITKDKNTGFTHYHTTYESKQNIISENKILENKNQTKPKEEITTNDKMPSLIIQSPLNLDVTQTPQPDDEELCPICNKQYELLDQTKLFEDCQHLFHLNCIQKDVCPICAAQPQQNQ
ncbi:unnamed protein product (macronuclear) [Paramecium tetraurelia]|uniref:RING-type domain-containing protein n=1 Tax=Paramecium tetraurelia TaxID=5888 RepID=A0BYE3_PARTE|nr:uncharacterized protein GSPATT00033413001 [Paramecium tetraurelia]CAK63560.1 unnamed protein product [Paramecium tetraurelia]|eukprot:XP_001430958.1 hypothetical protein (macronuclear) [Paramecium tetraurelia strain d4-2]